MQSRHYDIKLNKKWNIFDIKFLTSKFLLLPPLLKWSVYLGKEDENLLHLNFYRKCQRVKVKIYLSY